MKNNKLSFIGLALIGLVLAGCGETPEPGPKPGPEPVPSFEEFPLQMIVDALNRSKTFNDTFVGLDGADEYLLSSFVEDIDSETEYDVYGEVDCVFKDTSLDINKIASDYRNLLMETYNYVADEDPTSSFIYSPSNELQVNIEVQGEDERAAYYVIIVHFDNVINGNVSNV